MEPLFTIGFVNYKSSLYMETQFKIYQRFAGESFRVVVVDTSNVNEEFDRVNDLASHFDFPSLILRLDTRGKYASDAHGTGLQYIYERVRTEYFLTQDPDFFWVQPNFLTLFKNKLQDNSVVGASYHTQALAGWSGHPWFPTAFGAAHRMKDLKEVCADFRYSPDTIKVGKNAVSKDVGWQVREKLKDRSYYSFRAEPANLPIGPTYCVSHWQQYVDNQQIIAYHILRGTFELKASVGLRLAYNGKISKRERLRNMQAPKEWQENRKKACEFFWQEINKSAGQSI